GGSRPAAYLQFRASLEAAQRYARNPTAYDGDTRDALLNRQDAEALVPVVTGKMPILVHVESANDIRNVLKLRREFPALKLVLVGAAEGWRVAPEIAAAGVPVIANALTDLPASFEQLASTQSNVGRMKAAGVQVGIGMINDDEARQARYSPQYAGNLVALTKVPGATGLDWGQALAAITSGPAEALGMADQIGSLRPGRRADVVLWDSDPLEVTSNVERVQRAARDVERLIALLLALAKDPARLARAAEPVALDALLAESVDDHRALGDGKALRLHLHPPQPSTLHAPPALVRAAIGNLLRNAIEHSDAGTVHVRLQAPATVVIEDPGQGMDPEQISRLYARLARGGRDGGGIGLDLIARLCAHLGWRLDFAPAADGRGTVTTLVLDDTA
ncbi:amidohydrolase family protein, partial [Tolypothrix campylonemoides VB511288]